MKSIKTLYRNSPAFLREGRGLFFGGDGGDGGQAPVPSFMINDLL